MSSIVYRICYLLYRVLCGVGIGTNQGLFFVLLSILSGRLLWTRGALSCALADLGLDAAVVRRSLAALSYGRFQLGGLIQNWQRAVLSEPYFKPTCYEGYRPVACDLVGFLRPRLKGCATKHYTSQAGKALPAVVLGLVGSVGRIGAMRLALLRHVLAQHPNDNSEADLQWRLIEQAKASMKEDEVLVVDAGFGLADLLSARVHFVARVAKNFSARRNEPAPYKGRGRHPEYGERVRPRSRKRGPRVLPGTRPDQSTRFLWRGRWVKVAVFENLVLSYEKPGTSCFRCVVLHDPRYHEPLLLATNLSVSAQALFGLYRDRWPIEQVPLAAKQMLGAERAFVFAEKSRVRLPQMALLAGNILAYVAASSQPVSTGFWDRCARPTCGRLRRTLQRVHFSDLPIHRRRFRRKASPTEHLPKGFAAHNRHSDAVLTGK